MQFSGTFELENTTVDEVWLALSDPVLIEQALPGCEFLVPVDSTDADFDDLRAETSDRDAEPTGDPEVIADRAFEQGQAYGAMLQMSVGPVNPTFETVVTIDQREYPMMSAVGEGGSTDSSFEMSSAMTLRESDGGTVVDWECEADVFGRIAQMGQRVLNPVANQIVKRFFGSVQTELRQLDVDEDSPTAADDAEGRGIVDRLLRRPGDSDA